MNKINEITIDFDLLEEYEININEYLILYDIANEHSISYRLDYGVEDLGRLQKKGLVKLTDEGIFLRGKSIDIFSKKDDFFEEWLNIYPTNVKKSGGGSRALSPAASNTVLGMKLKKKWTLLFRKNTDKQKKAIEVLKAEISDKRRSGDLEYMVEATRWLNEGYHEKYEYLLEKKSKKADEISYLNEDWL